MPILCQPNFKEPFVVDTDASQYAIGAVLQQQDEKGGLHLITYLSKTLDQQQRGWDVYDRELFAVVEALKVWHRYLTGAKHQVLVQMDHNNLQYFKKPQNLNLRQARWMQEMADYNFLLEH